VSAAEYFDYIFFIKSDCFLPSWNIQIYEKKEVTMKRFSQFLLWATACAVFVAIAVSPAISADNIKMGFVFSMTGGAASYGVSQKEGAQLAVDQINAAAGSGMLVVPIFEDDASVPQQGTNVYNKLINGDKVAVIIGPTLSNTAKITNPIAQQIGVTVLGVSNTAGGITEIGDYIFRDSLTEAVVIPNTIRVAKEKLGIKKVVLFYGNDDAFTKSGADVFRKALQAEGIQILGEQTFAKGDRDFSPQLTQIKSQSPDAIICSALVEEASGIVNQARQLGIPKNVRIIGGNGFNSPALMKNAGEAAEGVIVGAAWNISSTNPLNVKFVEDYTKKYNHPPDQFAAQAFAGVFIAYQAAKVAGTADGRKAIRDGMLKIKGMDTPLGKFSFTEGRDADHTPVVLEVKDGKFSVFVK
jgi:branched-chain amino acid transport system substrate-binding protein